MIFLDMSLNYVRNIRGCHPELVSGSRGTEIASESRDACLPAGRLKQVQHDS